GVTFLDDAARPGERVVARRWRRRWPTIDFNYDGRGSKRHSDWNQKRCVMTKFAAQDNARANASMQYWFADTARGERYASVGPFKAKRRGDTNLNPSFRPQCTG